MLPNKGRKLPVWTGVLSGREIYAHTIAELLRKEHGNSHRVIKQLMIQTEASERTVKHWLSGQHGPDALHFLRLVASSPVIRAFVLGLIESPSSILSSAPVDRHSLAAAREAYVAGEAAFSSNAHASRDNDPNYGPYRGPISGPEPAELNERQHWFLARIVEGGRCGAREIMIAWQISLKTARRDISGLRQARLLEYVGSRRKGKYRHLVR